MGEDKINYYDRSETWVRTKPKIELRSKECDKLTITRETNKKLDILVFSVYSDGSGSNIYVDREKILELLRKLEK